MANDVSKTVRGEGMPAVNPPTRYASIPASEVYGAQYMADNDIDPEQVARVPYCSTCKHLPWDCECPSACEDCGEIVRGPGLCGHCHGGR